MPIVGMVGLGGINLFSGGPYCLGVVPEELEAGLKGAGWFPIALRLAAEVVPVALLEDERERLGDASKLQAQG